MEDDLDALLDSALEDFKKEEPVPKIRANVPNQGPSTTQRQNQSPTPNSRSDPVDIFSSVLAGGELPEDMAQEMKNLMSAFGEEFGDFENFNMDEFQKTLSDLGQMAQATSERSESTNFTDTPTPENLAATLENLMNDAKKMNQDGGIPPLDSFMEMFDGNPEFMNLMETVMDKFVSKEVLHEGLGELREKLEAWIVAHKKEGKLSNEELAQHEAQLRSIDEVLNLYATDGGEENQKQIEQLMKQLENIGTLPEDLLQDMGKDSKPCSIM